MPHFERLSALDASFLGVEDDNTHMHVGAVLILGAAPLTLADGRLDIERIQGLVESSLHRIPRYRQRLAYVPLENHPVWVDDQRFNLHYHVRHTSLPRPGDVRLLKRLAGRIVSQKLDRGKPLWELWVVEGLEGGRFALIAKAHHCMVDGISGFDMLAALLRSEPDAALEEPPPWRPRPAPSAPLLAASSAWRRARAPLPILSSLRRDPLGTLGEAWDSAQAIRETFSAGLRSASETPLNPPQIGPHRRFDWIRFDLDEVKAVRGRLGGTLNDVVLATTAGAVGRFLRGRGVDVAGLDFRAQVPVSVRRSAERGPGNRVSILLADLPIAVADPAERLRRVIETMGQLKHSRLVRGAELVEEIGNWTATALITQSVRLASRIRAYNLIVTNVPGPPVPLYLLEAPLLEVYPVVPLFANQAVGVALFSYDRGLYWGVNADWDRVPDLHDLIDALALEFTELQKSAA